MRGASWKLRLKLYIYCYLEANVTGRLAFLASDSYCMHQPYTVVSVIPVNTISKWFAMV